MPDFSQAVQNINYLRAYGESLYRKQKDIKSELSISADRLVNLESALSVLKLLLEKVSVATVTALEEIITVGINEVFEKDYEFKITTQNYKNRVQYSFILRQGEHDIDLDSIGGGIINFIDVLLRLFFVIKYPGNMRRVLILDEPFANLHVMRLERAGIFIRQLVAKLGFDVLMVSQSPSLRKYCDNYFFGEADSEQGLILKKMDVQ